MQSLHPDFQTVIPDTDYFFIGSGKICAALQWSRSEGVTPLGLLLWQPDHFPRKSGTHLFHPEYGLQRTMISVIIDGKKYRPEGSQARAEWRFENGIPQVIAAWRAGDVMIQEEYSTLGELPVIMRNIRVFSEKLVNVKIECALYANPSLFDKFTSTEYGLEASGFSTIRILSSVKATPEERFLFIDLGEGKELQTQLLIEAGEKERKGYSVENLFKATSGEHEYWSNTADIKADSEQMEPHVQLFRVASAGLRAAIGENGRFDSSIWQYGMEWGRDAAHVAEALVYSGQFELARKVLEHIMGDLVNEEGMVAEASRFRGGERSELDSNGAVLNALGIYYEWTKDIDPIAKYWKKISSCAGYMLREEFYDSEQGLLKATRDIWERGAEAGLKPGYDVAHQVYAYLGLSAASKLAVAMEDTAPAAQWLLASVKMMTQFGLSEKYHFMSEGYIAKRRLLDGTTQKELEVTAGKDFASSFIPQGMPLSSKGKHLLEPDVTQLLPIIHHMFDPKHEISTTTLERCESLWSQSWEGGGYGRYDVSGEPDSPGPWPLATLVMASAYFEAGNVPKAMEAMNWVLKKAGEGGALFEFYGERPTPPLPPVGILPWAWAQYITLFVRHILNARIEDETLIVKSRLKGLRGTLRFRDDRVAFTT